MLAAELERLAGSVLVGATPPIDAGTQFVVTVSVHSLLTPPQLGLNLWPERAR